MDDGKSAVLAIADALNGMRRDWLTGDKRMVELLSGGMKSSQGGFERLMKEERRPINEALSQMRRELIPAASRFLDPQLKHDVRELLEQFDTNSPHSDGTLRWRLTWKQLQLDSKLDNLISFVVSASRSTKQTQRTNQNRRSGEERISPPEQSDFFRNPKVIQSGCYDIANFLPIIRDTWQEGDDIEPEWRLKGWSTCGDTFLSAKRRSRYEVDRLLNKIVSDVGPVVLHRLDPSLRARLIRFCQHTRPYEYTDVHGDRGERWHLSWDELRLDDEVVILASELRAVGDSYGLGVESVDHAKTSGDAESSVAQSNDLMEWTKSQLYTIAETSASTFDRIRRAAGVKPSKRGGEGQSRTYTRHEVLLMIQAAEVKNAFRDGVSIGRKWKRLLGISS
ncbi:MAG: hypothetical protein ACF8K1_13870 [Phycisphaerales bacterium JB047]